MRFVQTRRGETAHSGGLFVRDPKRETIAKASQYLGFKPAVMMSLKPASMLEPYLCNFMPPSNTSKTRELTLEEEASTDHLSERLQDLWQKADAKRRYCQFLARRRREEQADEFRLMMLGIKPPSPATYDDIARNGWNPREASPDKKSLLVETQRARQALKDATAQAKAQEKERIRRENAALQHRIKHMKAATDNDVRDDEAGAARRRAAAESRARKAREREDLARRNAEHRRRLANTDARTDDDITDDVGPDGVIGAGRDEAAAASKARKAAEAKQLAEENAVFYQRVRSTGARVDDDITDDVGPDGIIGAGRAEAAAASRARKEADSQRLAAENAAFRQRVSATGAATDNDVTDDVGPDGVVGAGRAEAASASRARKSASARILAEENSQHKARINRFASKSARGSPRGPPVSI